MNNKRLGTAFENEMVQILADRGHWAHLIVPDDRGAQPFDIVAVKDGVAYAMDCKTSSRPVFPLSRLEDNQIMAFDLWLRCGNDMPQIAVKYQNRIFLLPYDLLRSKGSIRLSDEYYYCEGRTDFEEI